MKKEIIPAVLPKNLEEIATLVRRLERANCTIQIDICDGNFVSSQTWPYIKNTLPEFKDDFELPGWEDFDYELDLMIRDPQLHIDNLKNIGASRAIIHTKSTTKEGVLEACRKLSVYDIEIGIGIQNDDLEYSSILSSLEEAQIPYYIQIMGIDRIGKQGEPFSLASLDLVKKIHSDYPNIVLQVDGAVSTSTVSELSDAGVTRFVVGSWFSSGSIKDKIQELKNLI